MVTIVTNHRLSLEEVAHMESSIASMRRMVQMSHSVACHEFKDCHPMLAQLLRDYITACIDQGNSLLSAQATINKMYRFVLDNTQEEVEE